MVSRTRRVRIVAGFTLIEMLISLGIFAVVTGMVMANFRVGAQGDELRSSSQLVASALRRVQTSAIAGQTTHFCRDNEGNDGGVCSTDADCPGSLCVTDTPRGGYGLHFEATDANKQVMVTFADTDADGLFQASETVRRDNISPNIYVSVIGLFPEAPGPSLDVVFVPPKPSVRFNGTSSEPVATITLQHRSTQKVRTVTVNAISGQINSD